MKAKIIMLAGLIFAQGVYTSHLYAGGRGKAVTSCHSFMLTDSQLETLPKEALSGDAEAAVKLANYIGFCGNNWKGDWEASESWELIAAENGDMASMNNIVVTASVRNRKSVRDIFWLRRLIELGYVLGQHNISRLDSVDPGLFVFEDEDFPATPEGITSEALKLLEEKALLGSGRAALLLARHYGEVAEDKDSAEYWYRIGAQNNDAECQYRYGQILEERPEILDTLGIRTLRDSFHRDEQWWGDEEEERRIGVQKERGKFWKDRAAQGGYIPEALEL
jgi:TPR repeat protein